MNGSVLEVDLGKLSFNAAQVVERCHAHGIEVLGVTKGFSADPRIVAALLAGGVDGLADSRLENIIELRECGFDQPITLLRIPRLSDVAEVVRYVDTSVNSEFTVIQALAQAARESGRVHNIILMVDVGDLREGVMAENVIGAVKKISLLKGIKLQGLGTNMGCFGGVLPSTENLGILVSLKNALASWGIKLDIISGGGTSSLLLLEKGEIPAGINQLRVGEGILLGTDTTNNRKIPGLYDDAFTLYVEAIEVKAKPSVPIGDIGRDAFGNTPEFVDKGIRQRAILALGKQDVYIEGLTPVDAGMQILGASSDHLIMDITDASRAIKVGDEVAFRINYAGLLSACGSKYISKRYKNGGR